MDRRTENIINLMQQLGEEFYIPDEYINETPEEELVHDWDGGVLDEVK